jgi:hypothetical protein
MTKSCTILNYHKIFDGEMGEPYNMHGHDDNYLQNFSRQNLKRQESLRVCRRMALEYI